MTDDPYERYLDDFGATLERAAAQEAPRRTGSPRVRLAAVGVGAAGLACAIVALILLAPSGERRLDVLAEARAALAPRGEILHTVVRQSLQVGRLPKGVTVWRPAEVTEQWSATDPVRWRQLVRYPPGRGHPIVLDYRGQLLGTVERAYANRTLTTFVHRRGEVRIVMGQAPSRGVGFLPGPTTGQDGDPVGTLRDLLARGVLRDQGTRVVDGRRLRRLVWLPGRTAAARFVRRMEYDVDAGTFAPLVVRIRQRHGIPAGRRRSVPVTSVVRFLRFERLPLTSSTEQLLAVRPAGHPRILRMTAAEERRRFEQATHLAVPGVRRRARPPADAHPRRGG